MTAHPTARLRQQPQSAFILTTAISSSQRFTSGEVSSLQMTVILDDAPVKTRRTQTSPTKTRDLPRTRDVVETLRSRSSHRESTTLGRRRGVKWSEKSSSGGSESHNPAFLQPTSERRQTNHCWAHLNWITWESRSLSKKLNRYKTVKVCNYKDCSAVVCFHTHHRFTFFKIHWCDVVQSAILHYTSGIFHCIYDFL